MNRENLEAQIAGVVCRPLVRYEDSRGWLAEIFRQDELPVEHHPVMAYISVTSRGGVGVLTPTATRRTCFAFPARGSFG